MPTIPSIQSLVGAHSGGVSIGIDWAAQRCFQLSNTNLSRYGLYTGAEEAFAPLANMGGPGEDGQAYFIGVASTGNIFMTASGTLYNGAAMYVDGNTLAMINLIGYPSPKFGGGGMAALNYSTSQFCIDVSLGGFGFSYTNFDSTSAWLTSNGFVHDTEIACAGPPGTGVGYLLSSVNSFGVETGPCDLNVVQFNGAGLVSNTNVGAITMASIEPTWTGQFQPRGVCLDQTDNKLLVFFTGTGGVTSRGVLAKIDPATAGVDWTCHIPNSDGGGGASTGNTFKYSDIRNQRMGFYTGSPPTATIVNTATGTIDTQYTTGLAGLSNIDGQCYSDVIGALVLGCDFNQTVDSPTLLNSTPTSWGDGYAVLYLAAPPVPPANTRRWLARPGPVVT